MDDIKMMFGENARHIPMWMKTQNISDGGIMFVGASRYPQPYPTTHSHTLIIGEIIIRPHLVIGSSHCIGHGLNGLATEMDTVAWATGEVLCNPMGMRLDKNGKLVKL